MYCLMKYKSSDGFKIFINRILEHEDLMQQIKCYSSNSVIAFTEKDGNIYTYSTNKSRACTYIESESIEELENLAVLEAL